MQEPVSKSLTEANPETDAPDLGQTHHNRVNLIAGLFILLLVLFSIWVVKIFVEQERLQRCLDTRRTTCFPVEQRPNDIIRLPAH